jgi:hypothetical protein
MDAGTLGALTFGLSTGTQEGTIVVPRSWHDNAEIGLT